MNKTLKKDLLWGDVYNSQIEDMVAQGAVRKVTRKEMESHKGHVNFVSSSGS